MKARGLIDGASFGPSELKIVSQAFDEAWEQIGPTVSFRQDAVEVACRKLADVVLAVAKTADPFTVERIKAEALAMMFAQPVALGTHQHKR